ncbi:hypothetical protein GGTG_13298 [Gaeumannomyces tritici R3-111a-1]|uniref:Uncharacterized protein n=1 Tax=Gaeumannomyces tritici (strain R3-111a-1) TaxID=644352 RepID=J3PIH0_GAET3|nr:hypothetical protein GGTG_13298 [Gaeumannomyces tritici R3-111a-1]EJT69189.1 hypothetical protein GGTG_13298 [Gaeumannomyces tritici R3-111a-1]
MRGLGLCEEEFATFAKDTFFRGERRSAAISEDRRWRAERMLQLVCPPRENAHWRVPPLVDPGPAAAQRMAEDWSWDGFKPRYRFQIQNCTFVKDWITCPYFTIEFKRPGPSDDVAVAQVVAAGSIALYNRHRLREEALSVSKAGWKPEDTIALRHYALTFVGPKFVFWILQPLVGPSGAWKCCKTTRLCGADCTDEFGVREMLTWTNEIHR